MTKLTKNRILVILKRLDQAEEAYYKAESKISQLANFLQPYIDEPGIQTCMSSDGATITNDEGEIDFVRTFLNRQLTNIEKSNSKSSTLKS